MRRIFNVINPLAYMAVIVAASTTFYLAVVVLYAVIAWIFDFNVNWWAALAIWIGLFAWNLAGAWWKYVKDDPR